MKLVLTDNLAESDGIKDRLGKTLCGHGLDVPKGCINE